MRAPPTCALIRALALSLGLVSLLTACPVPIPALGYEDSSRENLLPQRPDFIVPGATRRAEVLLTLGEPDRAAEDERWFAYYSSEHRGGVAFVAGGMGGAGAITVQGYRERRLLVRFDAQGVVESAEFEERVCPRLGAASSSASGEGAPCLDVTRLEPGVAAPATPEALVAAFKHAVWTRSRGCQLRNGPPVAEFVALRGSIALTEAALLFTGGEIRLIGPDLPATTGRVPLVRIAALSLSNWPDAGLNVLTESGVCYHIVIDDEHGRRDAAGAARLRQLLEERSGQTARPL